MNYRYKQHNSNYRRRISSHTDSNSDEQNSHSADNEKSKIRKNKSKSLIQIPFNWGLSEAILVFVAFLIGFVTRNWSISQPRTPSSQEKYHIQAVSDYSRGLYFTPINPPFPELLSSYLSQFLYNYKYEYADEMFKNDGYSFPTMNYVYIRRASAILSSLSVPLIFIASRSYELSNLASFSVSFIYAFESCFVTSGKMASCYGLVQLLCVITIMMFSLLRHFKKFSFVYYIIVFAQSFFTALAVSSNYSALSLLAYAILFYSVHYKCPFSCAANVIMSLIVFFVVFYKHAFKTDCGIDNYLYVHELSRKLSGCLINGIDCDDDMSAIESISSSFVNAIKNASRKMPLKKIVSTNGMGKLVIMYNKVNGIFAIIGVFVAIPKIFLCGKPFGEFALLQYGCDISLICSIVFGGEDPTMLTIPLIFSFIIACDAFDKELSKMKSSFFFVAFDVSSFLFFLNNYSSIFGC